MKQSLVRILIIVLGLLLSPGMVLAQAAADDPIVDVRLEGYAGNVTLGSSTALMWMMLCLLAAVTVFATLKNANRSHLD